jgi:hypothetical protein
MAQLIYRYRESRLDLDPPFPGCTIAITLPSSGTTFLTRTQSKRSIVSDYLVEQDEDAYAKRYLATDAGLFVRRIHKTPSTFLWRLLNDRKVLEVRSVDLGRQRANPDASIILQLFFPAAIKPFCVALAEPKEKDAVCVFALTTNNDLYTITLRKEFFIRAAASEAEASEWCKVASPAAFGFKHAYRLFAITENQLVISIHDGSILRLSKQNSDDGSSWRETFFSEGGWSIKGLISWKGQNTVRFGNLDLAGTSIVSLGISPDNEHLFCVSLDHTLKAWNVTTGKLGVQIDLLGETLKDGKRQDQYLIGPSQSTLMQLVDVQINDGDLYYVVTYSPKNQQFKFWAILDADTPGLGIRDVHAEFNFTPPLDDLLHTTAWVLEEFYIKASPGWKKGEMWLRARSGATSTIFRVELDLASEPEALEKQWRLWNAVDADSRSPEKLKGLPGNPSRWLEEIPTPPADISNAWLAFLFYPGRFSLQSLETALATYRKTANLEDSKSDKQTRATVPLKERISASITATLLNGGDRFESADVGSQWMIFYGLVKDLHKRRGTVLSLAYDSEHDAAAIVAADYFSPLREYSLLERISSNGIQPSDHNAADTGQKTNHVQSRLLKGAHLFRDRLPAAMRRDIVQSVMAEILREPSVAITYRIQEFDSRAKFYTSLTDQDVDGLYYETDRLADLNNANLESLLELFDEPEKGKSLPIDVTHLGMAMLIHVSQDTLLSGLEVLLDLLLLVVFVALEGASSPAEVPKNFDAYEYYEKIIRKLQRYTVLSWLVGNVQTKSPSRRQSGSAHANAMDIDASQSVHDQNDPTSATIMERMCGVLAKDIGFPVGESSARLWTYWGRAWTFRPLMDADNIEKCALDVMTMLLARKSYDLAMDFSKFVPVDPWGKYLLGRMNLVKGDLNAASFDFRDAAYALSKIHKAIPFKFHLLTIQGVRHFDVNAFAGHLLDPDEKDYFSSGVPAYYQHVLGLFEKARAPSFAVEFANLGLTALSFGDPDAVVRINIYEKIGIPGLNMEPLFFQIGVQRTQDRTYIPTFHCCRTNIPMG